MALRLALADVRQGYVRLGWQTNKTDFALTTYANVLSAAGYTGFPASGANITNTPFPSWPCIAEAISLGDPDGTCDRLTVYSKTVQNDVGFSSQITWVTSIAA